MDPKFKINAKTIHAMWAESECDPEFKRRTRATKPLVSFLRSHLPKLAKQIEVESLKRVLADSNVALSDEEAEQLRELVLAECDPKPTSSQGPPSPPIRPQIILDLLLPPEKCEALVGDMEEIYRKKHKRVGKKGADLWYWKQVIITIWPLLRATRRLCTINVVAFVLRMLGLGRVADQLKAASRATGASAEGDQA
jgi:hypothetical protein